jgi:hypothetical protein
MSSASKLSTKSHLGAYQELLKKARTKLGLKTRIGLTPAGQWHFTIQRDKFVLHCPRYYDEPVFIHYMCHAKLLEDGLRRPKITFTTKIDKKTARGLVNRAADSFFDFWVWRLVIKKFGARHLKRFTAGFLNSTPGDLINGFCAEHKRTGSKLPAYLVCIDWFAMFYVLTGKLNGGRKIQKKLDRLWQGLLASQKFKQITPRQTDKKIQWLRKFYMNVSKKYPEYENILNNRKEAECAFVEYYKKVWLKTGLNVKRIKFFLGRA